MLTVVKVGGSLYDLPELGPRLRRLLDRFEPAPVLLVPGGGASADAVRALDKIHGLGEEKAHWLASHALSLTAHFLSDLLCVPTMVADPRRLPPGITEAILDPYEFLRLDEGRPGCLPHAWGTTSDAIAARAAVVAAAGRLILLKSASVPAGLDWLAAARHGFVDSCLARVVAEAPQMHVESINFRIEAG